MIRPKSQIREDLYIAGDDAKAFFFLLRDDRETIESELGFRLEWEERPHRRDCRIAVYLQGLDPENEGDWPRQHQWLATKLSDFDRVFSSRIRLLDASDWRADDEADQ